MEGVNETDAREAMRLAAAKLPIKTKFATRFARGEGVMKVGGVPRPRRSTSCGSARRTWTISCSGCGSRSRWGSSRRRDKLKALRRDLARVKTVLREKETA